MAALSCNNGQNNGFGNLDIKLDVRGMLYGIDFSFAKYMQDISVNMHAFDLGSHAINFGAYTNLAPQNQIMGAFRVTGYFDLDPYVEHPTRTVGTSGDYTTATGAGNPALGTMPFVIGWSGGSPGPIVLYDPIIKNCAGPFSSTTNLGAGLGNLTIINPTYICQPKSGNLADSNHLGVRSLWGITEGTLIVEDCNKQSATFGNLLWAQAKVGASAMPTSGYFFKGELIRNQAPSILGSTGSQYVVTGWLRLTTNTAGTEHTLNTDWVELHALTGA